MDRMVRVNELLKRELGAQLERAICGDVDCLVTVTAVNTSPDLHHAVVHVSVYGSNEQQRTVMGLLEARRSDLQRAISRNVRLKYTPVLRFVLDTQAADADHMMQILEELDPNREND